MSRTININDSISVHPTGVASDHAYASISNQTNGYNNSSNTTYATINLTTGSGATTYIYFTFDFSDIPQGATINSVSCTAKTYISTTNSSRITTRQMQLYSGSSAKGSATTISTSASAVTMSAGSWTREELQNARIRLYAVRGSSNTTSTYYFRFYGATFSVEYSINGTAYTINATSNIDGITVEPATQEILSGNDGLITIHANSLDDVTVLDNDIDVTNILIQKTVSTGGTIAAAPASYTTSGSISGTRYQSTIGHGVDNPSNQTGNDYSGSSGSSATIYYHFNFDDIPDNATIVSMTVQAYGHLENTSYSNEIAELNTYYGTIAKGTQVSYTATSNQLITINPGSWTLAELKSDARVGFTIGYYGGLTTGITWTVEYNIPSSGNEYYWEYPINNISTDHVIVIEQAGAFVPPQEDPEKTYYPITISTINATTAPGAGTIRVEAGTNETITITPSDPQLTLALDNGVDITNQLSGGVPTNTYTVAEKVTGATYGFDLNNSTGYYVSTNNGVSKSASVARLNLNLQSDCLVTISYINYAEANYDYGLFGKLDTEVATDGLIASSNGSEPSDSTNNYQIPMCTNSSNVQTITYTVPSGEHFIDIKYGKDDASDGNNDSLQWKVSSIEATSAGGDYTYILNNIQQKHSLIFVFGDVDYYFIDSSGSNCKLYPDGQVVKLDGDSYRLVIVPTDTSATVTLKDNNVDKTSSLEYEEGIDKNNNKIVNYIYKITGISAAHNIVVSCSSGSTVKIYTKINNSWTQLNFTKIYKKVNNSWVEQNDLTQVFESGVNYIRE